ncbi:hypothetical protein ACFX2I_011343 [Malus domestica]
MWGRIYKKFLTNNLGTIGENLEYKDDVNLASKLSTNNVTLWSSPLSVVHRNPASGSNVEYTTRDDRKARIRLLKEEKEEKLSRRIHSNILQEKRGIGKLNKMQLLHKTRTRIWTLHPIIPVHRSRKVIN